MLIQSNGGILSNEDEFLDLEDEFGIDNASDDEIDEDKYFVSEMGGAAIKTLLSRGFPEPINN